MKPKTSYRKRRDLMLKKFSASTCVSVLAETITRSGARVTCKRGRPCAVKKEKLIAYILWARLCNDGYEEMELESELYLHRHYDHSNFQYHYTKLQLTVLYQVSELLKNKILELTNNILLHIADSTALSTSVREERLVQGTRNKVKLTVKFHTLLGYDPPNKLVVVEGMLASSNHVSDSQGAIQLSNNKLAGYLFGDSAYETYALINHAIKHQLQPIVKPKEQEVKKKLSAKAQLRKIWNGNLQRLYRDIRGTGEVVYGGATRAGIIHTKSLKRGNQNKDSLLIGLRQNLFTLLRLNALTNILRKTGAMRVPSS